MKKEIEQNEVYSKKTFWNVIKSFSWGLFKILYISLWTVAILFIIWYFGSNYYYNMWYSYWQQYTKKAVMYDLINASQTCKIITIWTKKDKNLTKLINVACLKQQAQQAQQAQTQSSVKQNNNTQK